MRRVVTGALEVERRDKRIGSSLEAAPQVFVGAADAAVLAGLDLAELAITSGLELLVGAAAGGRLHDGRRARASGSCRAGAPGDKCARCWQVLPEVGERAGGARSLPPLRRCGRARWRRPERGAGAAPCCAPGLAVALVVVVLDQLTKWAALADARAGPPIARDTVL